MYCKHDGVGPLVDAFGPEFERLANQLAGPNRQGTLGLNEFRRIRDHRYTDTLDCDRGDGSIIEAYSDYDVSNRKRVMLFSNDTGFIERARDADLLAHHVAFPYDLPETTVGSWQAFENTLYVLSVIFGVIKLPGMTVFGVWNGKQSGHWESEQVVVECQSEKLEALIERHLKILERYQALQ